MEDSSYTDMGSGFIIHFLFAFLALDDYEDKLVVGGYQNLVLGSFQPHKFEIVLGIEIPHCIFGFYHQLRNQSGQSVAWIGGCVPYSLRSEV